MPLNIEALRTKQVSRGGTGWTPSEGANPIRLLPHTTRFFSEELDDFAHSFRLHYFRAEGVEIQVSRCFKDRSEYCPACAAFERYRNSEDAGLADLVGGDNGVRVVERRLLNILDLKDIEKGIQAYEVGNGIYRDLHDLIAAKNGWGETIVNPKEGVNLVLTYTPASKSRSGWNSYSIAPEPMAVLTEVMSILEQIEGWEAQMDSLGENITPYMEGAEIERMLAIMGVPSTTSPASVATGAPAAVVPAPASATAGDATPPAAVTPAVAPAAVTPAVAPAAVTPAAVTPAAVAPVAVEAPAAVTPAAVNVDPLTTPAPVAVVPGPAADKVPVGTVPAGLGTKEHKDGVVPECYDDWDPKRHPCDQCGFKGPCQIIALSL